MDDKISSESNSHFLITDDDILILTKDDLLSPSDTPSRLSKPSSPSNPSDKPSNPSDTPSRLSNPSRRSCLATTKRGGICKNRPFCDGNYCKLHHKQFSLEKPEECPVCMESLENTDIPLKCGHWVHNDCLMKWKEDTCPICRTEIQFTVNEKKIKRRIHKEKRTNNNDEVFLPPQILELIESLLRGVPEHMREEFIAGFLQVDVERNSILLGQDSEYEEFNNEEFTVEEIEDFPDISQ